MKSNYKIYSIIKYFTVKKALIKTAIMTYLIIIASSYQLSAQQVEVEGELKVTQMLNDNTIEDLVVKKTDGTLGTRSVASLPPPPPPIDTTRNLASDFELAKFLCDCPNLPPFMIQKLLDAGYTQEQLVGSGIPVQDVIGAQREGIVIDPRDNQAYKTVTIGTQTWMAENLNFGTRIDGSNDQTDNDIIEKYCYGDLTSNCDTYGGLYQWDEMMQYTTVPGTQGVCPTGWHLPTDAEWKTMEMELGMSQTQADASNYRGTDQGSQLAGNEPLWINGNLDQNGVFGSSGFEALPAGYRDTSGSFIAQSNYAFFWSSSETYTDPWNRNLFYSNPQVERNKFNKSFGFSVRCVQD
jgi:uncharacterized protein (TIGR02145 family)